MNSEYLKRDKAQTDNSEALIHETSPYYRNSHEKPVSGYVSHPAEREERSEPRELFSLKNSYNDLSIGADKKGDMMITGSAMRRHNSDTVKADEKRVVGSRREKHSDNSGELYTNPAQQEKSAFAYRVNRKVPEKKILKKLRESAKRHDLDRFNNTLFFLDIKENEETLNDMRRERASENEKQELEKTIRNKKVLERKFLNDLRFARKKLLSSDLDELCAELFGEDTEKAVRTSSLAVSEGDAEGNEDTDSGSEDIQDQ